MRAHARDTAAFHDHDAIGAHDGAHTLGDDDDAGLAQVAREGRSQAGVRAEVERREAVVEDEEVEGLRTRARAMARRWRWPPDTLLPPWVMGASRAPSMASTKSRAWATSRACHRSSSVAAGSP